VCGGYTSKSWDGSNKWIEDSDAFVFNMTKKYVNNIWHDKAIYTYQNGFCFGSGIL
jgi:hypothetical protein